MSEHLRHALSPWIMVLRTLREDYEHFSGSTRRRMLLDAADGVRALACHDVALYFGPGPVSWPWPWPPDPDPDPHPQPQPRPDPTPDPPVPPPPVKSGRGCFHIAEPRRVVLGFPELADAIQHGLVPALEHMSRAAILETLASVETWLLELLTADPRFGPEGR